MANITIYEFDLLPDDQGEMLWPATVTTTVATAATHTLSDSTKVIVLTTDADGRVGFSVAAVASGMPIVAAVPNFFKLKSGTGRTLRFV